MKIVLNLRGHFGCVVVRALTGMLTVPLPLLSQDSLTLRAVEVIADKFSLSACGKKTGIVDSSVTAQFAFNSLADLLAYQSGIFIKSYGPGAVASTALRGGNASQTAILWNGFNIQNPMLGQTDLSLLPAKLFNDISVEYGGSSALWGSGAVGGSLQLSNRTPFGKGFSAECGLGTGNTGQAALNTAILLSRQKFVSATKLYLQHSENNYEYRDAARPAHETLRQRHAAYAFAGMMQEMRFLISKNQLLSLNAWINNNHRDLPSFNQFKISRSYQDDRAARITADWNYFSGRFRTTIRGALLHEQINYTDSLTGLFSVNRTRTLIAETENFLTQSRNTEWNLGINFTSNEVLSNNYASARQIYKTSLIAGYRHSLMKDRLTFNAVVRPEYFSVGTLPVTGSLGVELKLLKSLSLLASGSRVYRQPTLNELYWIPGGNPSLRPEQGYSSDGTIVYALRRGSWNARISGSVFSRSISDWILWVPGQGGNPAPLNIQEVWSRGTETSWKLKYVLNSQVYSGINFNTAYVLSTISGSASRGGNEQGRQLIYTPRYTANGSAFIQLFNTGIYFMHQYSGYRFVTSDNTAWLEPFHVSSLRLSQRFSFPGFEFLSFLACNNLFNTEYAVIAGRPMPLRYFELGINIKSKANKIIKKQEKP